MSETLKILTERRSCRKYSGEKVPAEIIEQIVRCGTYAASGMGKQSPVILVIDNEEVRNTLSMLNARVMGTDGDPFYGAKQVIVVLADRSVPTYVYDGSLVMGNMMNAAADLGVASCWIHRAKQVFDSEEGKEILRKAGIEGDYEGIGNLIIGYNDNGFRPTAPRKADYIHWIK